MIDSAVAAERSSAMWLKLAEQIEFAIADHVIAGDPAKALQWACCAEACFWKATGECDTYDIKDIVDVRSATQQPGDGR